jgi:histidine ammonia-lyase
MTVVIDGESLSVEQVVRVARSSEPVAISEAVIERMRQSRDNVERVLARDEAVYGMTTGLGSTSAIGWRRARWRSSTDGCWTII